MTQRRLPILVAALSCASLVQAQLSLTNGDNTLEIGGYISTFYNQRFMKPGETDQHHDRFTLRNAVIEFEGRYRNSVEYTVQFDALVLAAGSSGGIDPENPGLMDANVTFKGIPHLGVNMGYGKVPFGRNPRVPFTYSPYWQRAEMLRGDILGVRDAGLTLSSSFWHDRAVAYAGVYTGLAEYALQGYNDDSGQPEYVGRVELSWPSRYRLREVDDKISPVPMFSVGASGRTMDKTQPAGSVLPAGVEGPDGVKVIDGKRSAIGIDAAAQYMGFSAQFELDRVRLEPQSTTSPLYHGIAASQAQGYILLGGYMAQVNYFRKSWHSIISARYEELNWNDLAPGIEHRIGGAYAYQIHDFNFMLKAEYWHVLEEEIPVSPFKWTDQVRIGVQYVFG